MHCAMLLELAKPLTLLASMISLLAVFHAAFLSTEADPSRRIYDALAMLILAAGISLLSGLAFYENPSSRNHSSLARTFPIQLFLWTTGIMLALFFLAWYFEANCIFEPHRHW
jgi:hypothetical protein